MIAFSIILLVLLLVGSGFLMSQRDSLRWMRLGAWALLFCAVALAHGMMLESHPVARMVGICFVLLAGLKGLVFIEWRAERPQKNTLPLGAYLLFALCWFGMNPGAFRQRRRGLRWRSDVWIGLVCMLLGTLGAWLVWHMEWRQVFIVFFPMSLGFHFGALRVLKGVFRACGYPVRTLFPNLFSAQGVADFWRRCWNVSYSQMMVRIVGRPLGKVLGRGQEKPRSEIILLAIFLGSGLLHELAITLPARAGYGLPTCYFSLHGGFIFIERFLSPWMRRVFVALAVVLPLGFLFPSHFQEEVLWPCLSALESLEQLFLNKNR